MRVPSPDARNVSNYMEANNIIKEEDEGDSDATSMRGAGKGKSTGVIKNVANLSTKVGTKYPTRETTPDIAAFQVVGPAIDKASNSNVPKHPSRQGSSQIAAQLILKEPRTNNNLTLLEIKSNDASSNRSNSLPSECSS